MKPVWSAIPDSQLAGQTEGMESKDSEVVSGILRAERIWNRDFTIRLSGIWPVAITRTARVDRRNGCGPTSPFRR